MSAATERLERRVLRLARKLNEARPNGFDDAVHVYGAGAGVYVAVERSTLRALMNAASCLESSMYRDRSARAKRSKGGGR